MSTLGRQSMVGIVRLSLYGIYLCVCLWLVINLSSFGLSISGPYRWVCLLLSFTVVYGFIRTFWRVINIIGSISDSTMLSIGEVIVVLTLTLGAMGLFVAIALEISTYFTKYGIPTTYLIVGVWVVVSIWILPSIVRAAVRRYEEWFGTKVLSFLLHSSGP